jgi:hypothetical protein
MSVQSILLPVFVEVGLTFALLFLMGGLRLRAFLRGEIRGDVALGRPGWPRHTTLAGNAYANQLELPVLFYVLTALALVTRTADTAFVLFAWIFVLLRIVHAAVHVTTNDMRLRFPVFGAAAVVLLVMWIAFALRILLAPVAP